MNPSSSSPETPDPAQPPSKRQAFSLNGRPTCSSNDLEGKKSKSAHATPLSSSPSAAHAEAPETLTSDSLEDSSADTPQAGLPQAFPSNWPADGEVDIGADGSSKRSNGRHHGKQASSGNRTGIGDAAQSQQQQQHQNLSSHGGDSKGREGDGEDVDEVVTQEADVDRILQGLAAQVQQLVDAAPPNTLLLMTTCQGNTAECRWLQVRRLTDTHTNTLALFTRPPQR